MENSICILAMTRGSGAWLTINQKGFWIDKNGKNSSGHPWKR
jgi:hypothetical protein